MLHGGASEAGLSYGGAGPVCSGANDEGVEQRGVGSATFEANLLVGKPGQEYVQDTLSNLNPIAAIQEIQRRGAIQDPRCTPLLGLLDQLGLSRCALGVHRLRCTDTGMHV
jgi:hypothetical protein